MGPLSTTSGYAQNVFVNYFFQCFVKQIFKFFLETNLFNIFVTICFSECFGKQMFSMFWFNIFVNNFCQNVLGTKFFNVLIVKKKNFQSNFASFQVQTESLERCSVMCLKNFNCNAFQFSQDAQQCTLAKVR